MTKFEVIANYELVAKMSDKDEALALGEKVKGRVWAVNEHGFGVRIADFTRTDA